MFQAGAAAQAEPAAQAGMEKTGHRRTKKQSFPGTEEPADRVDLAARVAMAAMCTFLFTRTRRRWNQRLVLTFMVAKEVMAAMSEKEAGADHRSKARRRD